MKNKEEPVCATVSYESYRIGNILSLMLKCEKFMSSYEEYAAYNYDISQGVWLNNGELLEKLDVKEEDYLKAVRRAAAKCYDDAFSSAFDEYGTWTHPFPDKGGIVCNLTLQAGFGELLSYVPEIPGFTMTRTDKGTEV